MGKATPFMKNPGRKSQDKVTLGHPLCHDKWRHL